MRVDGNVRRVVAYVVCLILVCSVGAGETVTSQSLEICVCVAKPEYVLGEPVLIEIVFTNVGDKAVEFDWRTLHSDFLKLYVRDSTGGIWRHQMLTHASYTGPETRYKIVLSRSASLRAARIPVSGKNIASRKEGLLFPKTGTYTVWAEYAALITGRQTLMSKMAKLDVKPVPPAEKEAFGLFTGLVPVPEEISVSKDDYSRFERLLRTMSYFNDLDFFEGTPLQESALQPLDKIMASWPGSVFAPCAGLCAGYSRAQTGGLPDKLSVAEAYLGAAEQAPSLAPLRDHIMVKLYDLLKQSGRAEQAHARVRAHLASTPDVITVARMQLKRIAK